MDDRPQYLTYWMTVPYAELVEKKNRVRKVGTRKVQKSRGIFNKETYEADEDIVESYEEWVGTGKFSDTNIDVRKLAEGIQKACNDYWESGYELTQMIDCIKGNYSYKADIGGGVNTTWAWGYGYGYSVTDGVVMVFRKRKEPSEAGL